MNTIVTQIRELQTMPAARLAARYAELFGKEPRICHAAWLRRQVAWKLQVREFGGLSEPAKGRLDELVAQIDLPLRDVAPRPRPAPRPESKDLPIGTTLVREWRGQQVRVEVRDNGFAWNGTLYKSLTAAVRAITNSAWNPKIFFGLVQRRAAK